MKEQGIIVFSKNPILGKAKTRLAKAVGDVEALNIYKKLLNKTATLLLELDIDTHIFYSDFIPENDLIFSDQNLFRHLQKGNDLGSRMYNAFEQLFHEYRQLVIIGTDCIQLEPTHIKDAFAILQKNNSVIGPSDDGGYYLLGLKNLDKKLFFDIEWSTESVFKSTINKVSELGWEFGTLEVLHDIDHIEDWQKFKHLCVT